MKAEKMNGEKKREVNKNVINNTNIYRHNRNPNSIISRRYDCRRNNSHI